jgi:8-oxo-dGTP pyrophosphatase MutT (NUDIX family)
LSALTNRRKMLAVNEIAFTMNVPQESMISPKKKAPAKRVQYAALPYRQSGGPLMEVLLITSRDTGRWIIPKGWPLKGKAPHKAAAREAREEAGLVGKIHRRPIGSFSYEKRLKGGKIVVCEVQVFGLKVLKGDTTESKLAGKRRAPIQVAVTTHGGRDGRRPFIRHDHPHLACAFQVTRRRAASLAIAV